MAKRTPAVPCNRKNCDYLFSECGKISTYTNKKCRCAACRDAWREYGRRYYKENSDNCRAYSDSYRERNPEKIKEYSADYRKNNPRETDVEYLREYRKNNPEKILNNMRRWRAANPEAVRRGYQKRRAIQKEAFVEDVQSRLVFERDGYICQRCGRKCDPEAVWPAKDFPTLDHIIPYAAGVEAGGVHSYANTQCLCLPCNSAKGPRQ